jgi:hypothetical protein
MANRRHAPVSAFVWNGTDVPHSRGRPVVVVRTWVGLAASRGMNLRPCVRVTVARPNGRAFGRGRSKVVK